MPRYVTIDLFGKVGVGKTTIFELFAGNRLLKDGGNLSYDFRGYYARCWVLPNRWNHSMIFLADPKLEWRWRDLKVKFMRKLFEPTNILMIVTDSTQEDVLNVKKSFSIYPKIKRKLIIFIIANMQDMDGRLSVQEIKEILGMEQVLGLNAKDPGAKEKVEKFMEDATLMYFLMLSKRGEAMELVNEEDIGFNRDKNKKKIHPNTGKYSSKISTLKNKLSEIEELEIKKIQEEKEERFKRVKEHKDKLYSLKERKNNE